MTEPNPAATDSPFPVREGANGPTDPDEEEMLWFQFGEPNQDGIFGAAVIE